MNDRLIQLRARGRANLGVALTDEISALLAAGSPVAIGVSGGKDSCAAALATIEHLDAIGHTGARILVHADLGSVEWDDSFRACVRLSLATRAELVVVKRPQGGMMERWLQRWRDNVERYLNLRCVKLILPWSTPDMRFCTSELKIRPICVELKRRFPGQVIINADGVRREESSKRKTKPIANPESGLAHPKHGTRGIHWRPIVDYTEADVFALCARFGFQMHEGYEAFNMTRISCVFCIMQSIDDMRNAIRNPAHHPLYREMVDLELLSGFAFQGGRWLCDLAPELLTEVQRERIQIAKQLVTKRQEIEAAIPEHLEFEEGWPRIMPTDAEAELLGDRREAVAKLYGWGDTVRFTSGVTVRSRYAELMAENDKRSAAKDAAAARKKKRAGKPRKEPAA